MPNGSSRLGRVAFVAAVAAAVALLVWQVARGRGRETPTVEHPPSAAAPRTPLPSTEATRPIEGQAIELDGDPVPFATVFVARSRAQVTYDGACPSAECPPTFFYCRAFCPWEGAIEAVAGLIAEGVGRWTPEARLTADAEGRFSWVPTFEGPATIAVGAARYAYSVRHDIQADRPPDAPPLLFALRHAKPFRGRVVDESGAPVVDAVVTAVAPRLPRFIESTIRPDGSFEIDGLGDAALIVAARAPGYLPTAVALRPRERPQPTLVLPKPRTLTGVVLDDDVPSAGALVEMRRGREVLRRQTSSDGTFRFDGLYPTRCTALARRGTRLASDTVLLRNSTTIITLRLEDGFAVAGQTLDQAGEPLPGVALDAQLGAQFIGQTLSTEDGRFDFESLPRGTMLRAWKQDFEPAETLVRSSDPLRVILKGAVLVTGVAATVDGLRIPDLQIVASNPDQTRAITDADGAFRLRLPAKGPITIRAHHSLYGAAELTLDAPAKDVTLTMELKGGFVAHVVDPSGTPFADADAIAVRLGDGELSYWSTDVGSDTDGRLVLAGLDPGDYRLAFLARDYKTRVVERVTLPAYRLLDLGKIQLDEGERLSGRVTFETGTPAPGTRVVATRAGWVSEPSITNREGDFNLHGLESGSFHLVATLDEMQGAADAQAGATDVVIRLGAARRFIGQVVDNEGRPIPHYLLGTEPIDSPDGRFESPIQDDRRRVSARVFAVGFQPEYAEAEVNAAGVADAGIIELDRARDMFGRVVDAGGQGVANAMVEASASEAGLPAAAHTVTASDGSFRLDDLPPGALEVSARKGTQVASEWVVVPDDDDARDVEIVLQPQGAVAGTVRFNGKAVAAELELGDMETATDGTGRFLFDGVVPGEAYISVTPLAEPGRMFTRAVYVTAGEPTRLDLDLAQGATLTVRVEGFNDGLLSLQPEGALQGAQLLSINHGFGVFRGLPAGAYQLFFSGVDGVHAAEARVDLTSGLDTTVTLQAASRAASGGTGK